jgi:hypothetical protein
MQITLKNNLKYIIIILIGTMLTFLSTSFRISDQEEIAPLIGHPFRDIISSESILWGTDPINANLHILNSGFLAEKSYKAIINTLKGQTIVLIGDSLTRYQYLSLVYFLEYGVWSTEKISGFDGRHVINEKQWGSWNDYYNQTNHFLRGRETCDCLRNLPFKYKEAYENRLYENNEFNFRIYYFQFFKLDDGLKGHYGYPPSDSIFRSPSCAASLCPLTQSDWRWQIDVAQDFLLPLIRPNVLVMNSGLWGSTQKWPENLLRRTLSLAKKHADVVIWKTTTQNRDGGITNDYDKPAIEIVKSLNLHLMDAWALTDNLHSLNYDSYWDTLHFEEHVYRELNLYLIRMIESIQMQ